MDTSTWLQHTHNPPLGRRGPPPWRRETYGGNGNESIAGGQGNDTIEGGNGKDILAGDAGGDLLTGGAGADRFVYRFTNDSRGAGVDTITDFTHGIDKVDLSALGPLEFIGHRPVHAAHQVRAISSSGHTLLQVNTVGSGGPEMAIAFTSLVTITESDLLL